MIRRTKRSGSFWLCLLLNMILNLEWTIPAWILLALHFVFDWSIWWFVLALALWILNILFWMKVMGWAADCSCEKDPPKENKNPYSVKQNKDVVGDQDEEVFSIGGVHDVHCLAAVLLGCGKGHLVDGPGMERGVWSEFTLSRCSETFETVYRYTVHYDEDLNEAELYIEVYEGRTVDKRAKIDKETISKLYNLDLLSLPEAEPVAGNFLGLSVTDRNGQTYSKQISKAKEEAVLAILAPYLTAEEEDPFMLDGPSMEYTPPWTSFTISRMDSNARYHFWFTVTDADPDAMVTGECVDEKGNHFEDIVGIPISVETLQTLQWMNLEQLTQEEEWPENLERPTDDRSISLAITLSDGTVVNKKASGVLSLEIYQILLLVPGRKSRNF